METETGNELNSKDRKEATTTVSKVNLIIECDIELNRCLVIK